MKTSKLELIQISSFDFMNKFSIEDRCSVDTMGSAGKRLKYKGLINE